MTFESTRPGWRRRTGRYWKSDIEFGQKGGSETRLSFGASGPIWPANLGQSKILNRSYWMRWFVFIAQVVIRVALHICFPIQCWSHSNIPTIFFAWNKLICLHEWIIWSINPIFFCPLTTSSSYCIQLVHHAIYSNNTESHDPSFCNNGRTCGCCKCLVICR